MNRKIIYFIHVPWKWIKQRPHFIAEELSKDFEVVVAEWKPFDAKYISHGKQSVNLVSYFQLPKDRIPIIHVINSILQHIKLGKYVNRADVAWFTNPYQYSFYKRDKILGKIVYDCMDDLPEFEPTEEQRKKIEKLECRLYKEADVVIASSYYLKGKLAQRYGEREVEVVNNAIKRMDDHKQQNLPAEIKEKIPSDKFIITYIGTIEKWIDFNLVVTLLDMNPKVAFCFFGPLKTELPQHERIHYCGMVSHDLVFSVMDQSDALIMPFVLNELILSVNPVKLYEYIYSGKPCLAPRYGESECFEEYVYLYNSPNHCCDIVKDLVNGKGAKHTAEECKAFALSNTWKERVEQIERVL